MLSACFDGSRSRALVLAGCGSGVGRRLRARRGLPAGRRARERRPRSAPRQAGQDRYPAGILAQATGFWYGTGMLLDGGGDDVYDDVRYVQSGSAHPTRVLLEDGGNDFDPGATRRTVMMGGGHDFSMAWLVDREGDDVCRGTGIGFGAGYESGAGIFADLASTDTYEANRDNAVGHAAVSRPGEDALRRMMGTVGIFLEADGVDVYDRPTIGDVGDDATRKQARTRAYRRPHGAGATGLE